MNIKTIAIALTLGCAMMAQAAADKVVGFFPYCCLTMPFTNS